MGKNAGYLLERLKWLTPDPDEMSWEPSNVVYILNMTPTEEELDRRVETKPLLVKDSKPAGASIPTASRIEYSSDNGFNIVATEAEKKGKGTQETPAFGCGSGHSSSLFSS